MTSNPNIKRFSGGIHSLVMLDDWLLAIFRTNMEAWRFLSNVGADFDNPERKLPDEIYILLIAGTLADGLPHPLEIGKIVRKKLNVDSGGDPEDRLIYMALYDSHEAEKIRHTVKKLWPQIQEVMYDD